VASHAVRMQRLEGQMLPDLMDVERQARLAQQRALAQLADAALDALGAAVEARDADQVLTAEHRAVLDRFQARVDAELERTWPTVS
jgi:hypothetical protein